MKGVGCNISKLALLKWAEFEREFQRRFGAPNSFRIVGQCIKVVCCTLRQKSQLMHSHDLLSYNVTVTEPFSLNKTRSNNTQKTLNKTVIRDVPLDISDDDIKQSVGCVWVKRIISWVQTQRKPSGVVVLGFEDDAPKEVTVGSIVFKVMPYLPKPLRCTSWHTLHLVTMPTGADQDQHVFVAQV